MNDERYATTWHGLFPRFILAGAAIIAIGTSIQLVVTRLLPAFSFTSSVPTANQFNVDLQGAINVLYFPFAVFMLFYLAARIRINLDRDYAMLAASILLGTVLVLLFYSTLETLVSGSNGTSVLFSLLQSTASALSTAIQYAFIGFVAVLLSFRRRM